MFHQGVHIPYHFHREAINHLNRLEEDMGDGNIGLNRDIEYDEVEKVVGKAKKNKAPGPDYIPNEVLKDKNVLLCSVMFHNVS